MPPSGKLNIRHAYRHLYRGLLRAVQYSKPARYCARDELREAFRKGDKASYDPIKIARTLEFLDLAVKYRSTEHHIIKSVLQTKFWAKYEARYKPISKMKNKTNRQLRQLAMVHYERTLKMLNNSLNICLR
ncbi:hypothetical protein GcM3_186033 [Golovinomyces cichoracearum]|uniref:Uncharacterized protein n=1 Tax=Golovinomyces cichoracearum TaxID=62708 RepID=A0A420HJZ1_9PEZI|nr:hypothetical protein GcM3_186033 [Golovinomyces cichoracearum]